MINVHSEDVPPYHGAEDLERLLAFKGQLELLGAAWNLKSGRTVEFRVVEQPGEEPHEHEFKRFGRRRGGRMGQRFHACCVAEGETVPAYDAEFTLAGWSESDKGRTVKFWLDEFPDRHPLAGFKERARDSLGTVFACVLVALQDDEQPVDEVAQARLERAHKRRRLSQDAHLIVTNPLFSAYLAERQSPPQGKSWEPELARRWIKWKLGLESLSELDHNETAAKQFHELRASFVAWQGQV